MNNTTDPCQAAYLHVLLRDEVDVSVCLMSGTNLIGQIVNFDRFCLWIKSNGITQLIFKHGIEIIRPSHEVAFEIKTKRYKDSPADEDIKKPDVSSSTLTLNKRRA